MFLTRKWMRQENQMEKSNGIMCSLARNMFSLTFEWRKN